MSSDSNWLTRAESRVIHDFLLSRGRYSSGAGGAPGMGMNGLPWKAWIFDPPTNSLWVYDENSRKRKNSKKKWWARSDSNTRPAYYKLLSRNRICEWTCSLAVIHVDCWKILRLAISGTIWKIAWALHTTQSGRSWDYLWISTYILFSRSRLSD